MIKLSNGHEFEYMAASGALGFDGKGWPWEQPLKFRIPGIIEPLLDPSLFTTVIKTLTFMPRKGNLRWYNPMGCVRFLNKGTLNAIGLTNPGIKWWCEEIGPKIDSSKRPIVGSVFSDDIEEMVEMALMLNDFDLVGLEINRSCPNTGGDCLQNASDIIKSCGAVHKKSRFPIIVKLSVAHPVEKILPGIAETVEAISINSVPWSIVFPDRRSPLVHLGGGGVSGKAAQPFTWGLLKKIVSMTDIPVIGPGVWEFSDIQKIRDFGAKAESFGSIFMPYPWRPTKYVRKDIKQILKHDYPLE